MAVVTINVWLAQACLNYYWIECHWLKITCMSCLAYMLLHWQQQAIDTVECQLLTCKWMVFIIPMPLSHPYYVQIELGNGRHITYTNQSHIWLSCKLYRYVPIQSHQLAPQTFVHCRLCNPMYVVYYLLIMNHVSWEIATLILTSVFSFTMHNYIEHHAELQNTYKQGSVPTCS